MTWTNVVRLVEEERRDVLAEVDFEAALAGDVMRHALARAIYDALAPKVSTPALVVTE